MSFKNLFRKERSALSENIAELKKLKCKTEKLSPGLHELHALIKRQVLLFLLAASGATIMIVCFPLRPKEKVKERPLVRPLPTYHQPKCSTAAEITEIESVPAAYSVIVLRVHFQGDPPDVFGSALASTADKLKIGDEVEICYMEVLRGNPASYTSLAFARKLPAEKTP